MLEASHGIMINRQVIPDVLLAALPLWQGQTGQSRLPNQDTAVQPVAGHTPKC